MTKQLLNALRGGIIWWELKCRYHIDENTIVLMMPEYNMEWNKTALKYLPYFKKRKGANRTIVFLQDKLLLERVENERWEEVEFRILSGDKIRKMMDFYCLHRFFDKIVFFYLDYPQDNKSKLIIDNGSATMDELICLHSYGLRRMPSHV